MTKAWVSGTGLHARRRHSDRSILGPLCTAIGTQLYNQRRRDDPTVITYALAEAGLPESLAVAATSTKFDQLIMNSHDEVGLGVGTPVLLIGGTTLFGPRDHTDPRGEAAGQLWDGLVMVAATDGFFELKRSRDRKPSFE